jgi:hypothetical protein
LGRDTVAAAVPNITCCSVIRTSADDGFACGTADGVVGLGFSVTCPNAGADGGDFRVPLVVMAFTS